MIIIEPFLLVLYILLSVILLITYIFYPILSKKILRTNQVDDIRDTYGQSYIIIPAYNEENVIKEKINNTLLNMGPKDNIVVVSDGSNDKTNSICQKLASEYKEITFYLNHERGGKNSCLNLAIENIKPNDNDILIFTDCNTFFDQDSISEIIKSLQSGSSLVAGSMVYKSMESESAISEGLYWKYEEWIRRNESEKGRLIVCNGGLFGMWADCYNTLPAFVPNDFEAPLRLCGMGKNVIINSKAIGIEIAINSSLEEYSRKERMANRQMNCIIYIWKELNTGTKAQVLFHKLIRWFGLHLFVLSTAVLFIIYCIWNAWFLKILILLHFLVLGFSAIAFLNNYIKFEKRILPKLLHTLKVHYYGSKGSINAFKGRKTSVWDKAKTNR